MPVARRGFVSMDCSDARPLAEFWAAMLGGEIAFTSRKWGVLWQVCAGSDLSVAEPGCGGGDRQPDRRSCYSESLLGG
jgi:hypothetical protein